MIKKIALVGLGPHAKRIYCGFINNLVEKGGKFEVLIELESKRSMVEIFFKERKVKPCRILYIPDKGQLCPKNINEELKIRLNTLISEGLITHAIVATEPKAHKIYIEYFLKNRIPCLTDKPITAPVGLSYNKKASVNLVKDVNDLINISNKYKTPVYVQVQRREHCAYIYIFKLLAEIVKKYRIPITYFNIYHSDGNWSMPPEFYFRENHPYKYGYGKLMHSGYHFVDLIAWICEINKNIYKDITIETTASFLKPETHYNQINGNKLYDRLFAKKTKLPQNYKFGEIDSYTNFSFYGGHKIVDSKMITKGNLDLLQSGFSRRAWFDLPKDTYKGNGRVRHEYININVGPLFNIQLHSYQSNEINKGDVFGVGGEEHLDLYIFRNSDIIGGKSCEVIDFGKRINNESGNFKGVYFGQNELSRYIIFDKFLKRKFSDTMLDNQLLTNKILSSIYESYVTRKNVLLMV